GAYDTSSHSFANTSDIFVSRLNRDLTAVLISTYLGGGHDDSASSLAIDSGGNVYVVGSTESWEFPITPGAYDDSFNSWIFFGASGPDAFISKLNGDLSTLLASTYLGGEYSDYASALTIDTGGNIYVVGKTQSYFPTTPGAYDTSLDGGAYDVFVSKFTGDLTNLLASTYLGGTENDGGRDTENTWKSIAIDTDGNIYVTGSTESTDFPTTQAAYDTSYNGYYSWTSMSGDIFVSKLNGALTSLLASTYLGGSVNDSAHTLAIDQSGNIYVAGETDSPDFPITPGAYDTSYNGNADAFVAKLNGNLTNLLVSTYLGGNGNDSSHALAIDPGGNIYVAGITGSTDFPTTSGAYDTSFNGVGDAFVSKLSGDLTNILAATYLGGGSNDSANALAIDPGGNIYVTGYTYSTDFLTTSGAYDTSLNSYRDAFIARFSNNLSASPITVPSVHSNLIVNGTLDEPDWNIATEVNNVVIGTTNNTTKFGVLWDSTYLYVGMKVLDDNLYNDSTNVWDDDGVEIYIDGDHNRGTTYDSYDRQFIKGWNDPILFEKHGKTTGVLHGWAPISGGYSIEFAIPWSNLGITPAAGMTLGFSAGYNDDDNGAVREGLAVWIGTANNNIDTSAFGEIVLEEAPPVTVPHVSTNLAVDGNVNESAWDIATDVSKMVIGTTNNTVKFGVLWD
ncbi:hypothetical protein MTYM_01996, partial [Methylococcales bacterium]